MPNSNFMNNIYIYGKISLLKDFMKILIKNLRQLFKLDWSAIDISKVDNINHWSTIVDQSIESVCNIVCLREDLGDEKCSFTHLKYQSQLLVLSRFINSYLINNEINNELLDTLQKVALPELTYYCNRLTAGYKELFGEEL